MSSRAFSPPSIEHFLSLDGLRPEQYCDVKSIPRATTNAFCLLLPISLLPYICK